MREAINEEAISDHQGLSMAIIEPTSGNHWQSMALTEASAQSMAIINNQWQSMAIINNQWQSMAIINNQWQSMALTEASAQTSLAADWVVSEDVLVIISLISGTISAASSKPSSRSERLPETTLDGMAKLGS